MFALPNWPKNTSQKYSMSQDPLFVCLFVYNFSHTVEHKVNTQALELSEPTMNITEMTTERYEHPFKFSFCNCYITDWNSMPYLNVTS